MEKKTVFLERVFDAFPRSFSFCHFVPANERKLVGLARKKERKKEEKRGSYSITDKDRRPPGFVSLVYHRFIGPRSTVNLHFLASYVASVAVSSAISKVHGKWDRRRSANRSHHRFVLRFTEEERSRSLSLSLEFYRFCNRARSVT